MFFYGVHADEGFARNLADSVAGNVQVADIAFGRGQVGYSGEETIQRVLKFMGADVRIQRFRGGRRRGAHGGLRERCLRSGAQRAAQSYTADPAQRPGFRQTALRRGGG